MRRLFPLVASSACLLACTSQPAVSTAPELASRCEYDIAVGSDLRLDARLRCDVPIRSLVAHETSMADQIDIVGATWSEGRFILTEPREEVSYSIDLLDVAARAHHPDVAYAHQGGCIAAGSTWLLEPKPSHGRTAIRVRVQPAPGVQFATGLHRDDKGFWLEAREIRFATYGVFGNFTRERLRLPGPISGKSDEALLEIVTLPGDLESDRQARRAWIHHAARAVSDFWQGFPVSRALLAIVPSAGRYDVEHGKVVASGGPSIVLQLGGEATEAMLYDDWVLVHELFHLGFPSFVGEGKWLDEGLATYYEPIVRARAGWQGEADVWNEFYRFMPQGLSAVQNLGVENTDSASAIYWGGAILALFADVAVREDSAGVRGLEDGLRAVLAHGGDATQVWELEEVIAVIDRTLGKPVMRDLAASHAHQGHQVAFGELFDALGVNGAGDAIALRDDAPKAGIRRTIVHPSE